MNSSLTSEADFRVRLNPDFYDQVDCSFVNSYFAMLLANGLAADLVNVIASNRVLIEHGNGYEVVLHIGSIKLHFQPKRGAIGVITSTHDELGDKRFSSALMITFWRHEPKTDLVADFMITLPSGDAQPFGISLPNTCDHALATMLGELNDILKNSDGEKVGANLKNWAVQRRFIEGKP